MRRPKSAPFSRKTRSASRADEIQLGRAIYDGDEAKVESLLRNGVDIEAPTWSSSGTLITPLVKAVMHSQTNILKILVHARANPSRGCGPDNETALHVCCSRGDARAAKILIDAGAELGPPDSLGRSPLFCSALMNRPDCTALMLEARADIEQPMTRHNPGATPLYAAALGQTCVDSSVRCISLLCEAGANVNAHTADGATPMMVACECGLLETSMLLSSFGASRQPACFQEGQLPAHHASWAEDMAARSGCEELSAWLRSSADFSPLHHVEVLSTQRTLALLRTGRFSPHAGSCSPADRARERLLELRGDGDPRTALGPPRHAPSSLILRASQPWSPSTHELWGAPQRARAFELLKLGYLLRATLGDGSVLDWWVAHVMPHALSWNMGPAAFWSCLPRPRPPGPQQRYNLRPKLSR